MKRFLSLILAVALLLSIMPTGLFSVTINAETTDSYTITYHLDGGTNAAKNPDAYTEEDNITLKDATKVGYDFAGWFLDANKTEQINEISNRTGNLNLYAKFSPKSYTATFDSNGATNASELTITLFDPDSNTSKTYSVNNGDIFDPYTMWIPQKSGYVFNGWYNGSQLANGTIDITADITLTARYTYCNTPDDILGKNTNELTCSSNSYYGYYPTTVYFYVDGSYDTITYSGATYLYDEGVGSDSDYYANFYIYDVTKGEYLVSCTSSNGFQLEKGTVTVSPGSLYKMYYECKLSSSNQEYTGTVSVGTKSSANIVVLDNRTYECEYDDATESPAVSKTGYSFKGWYDTNGNKMTEMWQYTENQTFTAKWEAIKYNVSYELNGGTNNISNPSVYTIEDSITLKSPSKPGYTFKGWYSDSSFLSIVTEISQNTGDLTLYAKFEANDYTLILDGKEGAFLPKLTFVSDNEIIKVVHLGATDGISAFRPVDKEGYVFAGWYTDSAYTSLFEFNRTIASDITLYAKWVECSNNVVFVEAIESFETNINGKNEQIYAFIPLTDGKISVLSESDGLDLYGMLYDSKKSVLVSSDDISDSDLDFSYTYNVKAWQLYYIVVRGGVSTTNGNATIKVNWDGDATWVTGTTYKTRQYTITYDTNYLFPEKPIREGYVFLGWFDENDTQITDGTWSFITDQTLTAKWEEATYHTVVFKDLAGNIISSETYYLSEDIIAPKLPTKTADETYTYHAKWNNDYTGVCTGDAVYSPIFDAEYIEYTVIFADEDGTEFSKATYHWGDTVTPPTDPTKDIDDNYAYTYTFAGWNNTVVNCVGDATYTATYTAIPLEELVLISQPNQVRYRTGERLNLTGLALRCVYANDASVFLENIDAQFVSADLSTPGKKTVTITIVGKSVEFEIYVHDVEETVVTVDSALYPQSSHDYSNNLDETKTFTYPGAQSLVITFNSQTSVENNYDYIYVYDGAGNLIAKYTGTTAANKTLEITGDTFKIRLTSDSSNVKYGYSFSGIQANMKNTGEIIHQPVIDPATVTCTQNGLTEGSHCDICGDVLVAQEEIAALGHDYKTVFTWSEDHTSCAVAIACDRGCGLSEMLNCTVTHSEPNQAQTTHTAVAEYDGQRFTDILTCGSFLITFKDWDGIQISSTYYHAGDTVIAPTNPTRAADQTYTYTFAGWDKTVVNCAGDATYTATYTSTYIDYTVVFKNWNGSVISTKTYHYGDKVMVPENPVKDSDDTNIYVFAGWDKTVVDCVGDAIYTATYTIHADHIYDNACDTDCNICNHTRTITHSYKTTWDKNSMQHWHQCSVCGNKKDLEDHIFDNACDTTCNTCGYTRTITHNYKTVWEKDATKHWHECSVCGTKKDTADHIYNNACDTTCNTCAYVRTVGPHVYDNVCDSTCNICGFRRDNIEHSYDNACDATCNLCGTIRTPGEHVYDDNDDHYCNVCNLYTLLRYQINYWNNSVTITGFDENYNGAFVIPETINGYPVTEIESYAFYNCSNLTSITIPNSISRIWGSAFSGCDNLSEVHISDISAWCNIKFSDLDANPISCGYFGDYHRKLFLNGSLVTDVVIPDGITEIGDYAFYGYSELKSVHIPDSVNSIGYASFRQCTKLAGIVIPNNVITIGDYAFAYCESIKMLTLGNQVAYIGECTFAGCDIAEVAIPKSVTMMGNVAFCGDTPIKIEIENIESWCNIQFNGAIVWQDQGLNLYMNGNPVTELVIPEGVTTITNCAFAYCTNLKSVSFPNSLIAINDNSFYGCTGITSVVIPKNVSSFSVGAFKGCTALASLSVVDNNATYHSYGNCIIETNSKTLVLGIKNSTIPSDGSVTIIGDFAFDGCDGLKYVVIPNGVTTINYYAFGRCKDLIAVDIPKSVTSIESAAFDECTSLTNVALPAGLTTLNQFVFANCYSLTNITIPKSMTNVMYAALRYCPITNIYYSGDEDDKALMEIGENNGSTPYATWHYNTCETHIYDNACDGTCNSCSWVRFSWSHTFTDENDLICNTCAEERYIVIFKNYDGTILSENKYYYGDSVTVPNTPTKPNDDKYSYAFKGWDKTVTSCNGNATYTATYTATSLVPDKITSSKHAISGNNISKIAAGTTVSSLLSGLNEGSCCKVYKGSTQVSGTSAVGTGMVVKIMDGNTVKAEYTVIVTGDTNGDGAITITDMIAIKAHVLKKSTLTGAYATAADTNGDNGISITDFIQVKANILEKGTITAR